MTIVAYAVAAALALVAGAATAYAAVSRVRAGAAIIGAAVLATSTRPVPSVLPVATVVSRDDLAAIALVVLAAVMAFGVRWIHVGLALGAALRVLGPFLLWDPFRDPACQGQCPTNPWAVAEAPTAASSMRTIGFVVGLAALILLVTTRPPRPGGPALGARAAGVVITCCWLLTATGAQNVEPQWVAAGAGLGGLVALVGELARAGRARGRLREIVDQLAHADDPHRMLRDLMPGRAIEFRLDGSDDWVDADGRPRPTVPTASVMELRGPEGTIARVLDPGTPAEVRAWSRQLRGPARLALDNARRTAQSAHEERAITESARRLVATADQERRRLERDLHDGAQQHVLTLGLLVTLRLDETPLDDPARPALESARLTVSAVLDDLRELAHGIHAAELDTRGGLRQALGQLANRAPVPLELGELEGDPDSTVRLTAYALVEEVVATAGGPVHVAIFDRRPWQIVVGVTAAELGARPTRSADRFRALGGRVTCTIDAAGRHTITGTLP